MAGRVWARKVLPASGHGRSPRAIDELWTKPPRLLYRKGGDLQKQLYSAGT